MRLATDPARTAADWRIDVGTVSVESEASPVETENETTTADTGFE